MLGDAEIKFTGNLAADPDLRITPSGNSVCSFSVAVTPRKKAQDGSGWSDGAVSWFQVTCWQHAENVAASLHKGDRVTVIGTVAQRSYDKDGVTVYTYDVTAEEVAASLRFASVEVKKAQRAPHLAAVAGDEAPF
jgi:single-strand DNA-binding protein